MKLTLRQKIVLPTAAVAILALLLLLVLMLGLYSIRKENVIVRDMAYTVDHVGTALASAQRMQELLLDMTDPRQDQDELHFYYLEQYWLFSQAITHPTVTSRMPELVRQQIIEHQSQLGDIDSGLNEREASAALDRIIPQLTSLNRGFLSDKRKVYIRYYETVNSLTTSLLYISSFLVALIIVVGGILVAWATQRVSKRIASLAQECVGGCADGAAPEPGRGDELDELARCVSGMRRSVSRTMNSAKMVEVAEDERRRIAMDLHDLILSDLTHLSRDISVVAHDPSSLPMLQNVQEDMEEVMESIRAIMDELHPQTLDMLGLEAALRSYLERKLARPGLPAYFINVESCVESVLSDFQKLTIYRIAVEAINNTVRHACCTRYEVECRISNGFVSLSVEDNGIGIPLPQGKEPGRGLFNIEERAKAIGATVNWEAARFSSGTRFAMFLAVPKQQTVASNF